MFRLKPFLVGFFICFALFLHVQPLFGGVVVKTETKVKTEGKGANEENGNEGEAEGKKIGSLEEKSKSAEDSKKKGNEEEIERPENMKAKEHSGAENEEEKIFEEAVKKDIDVLKEHLEHEKQEGKHGLEGNSDPKEIIHYMLVHLENIDMGCDRQKQYDWECGALSQIRNEEVKWLDFLLNRESFEKGDLKYLAVRPVVKRNTQMRNKFPEMWEDVGLKEVLEAIEKYNKNERPSVDFSLHNDEECSLVQRMVHELKEGEEHKNEEKIKKAKEAIRVFWEKEKEVICGKSFKFKEEEHNKKMETHKAQKWTKVFPSRSRLAMQQQEMEAKSRKEGGHNNEGNKEGEMKLEMEEEEEGEGVKGHQGENKGGEEKKGKEAKTKEKKAEAASGAAEEQRGNGGAGKEGGGMHRSHH